MRYFLEDIKYQATNHTQSFINFCESQYNEQVYKVAQSIRDNAKATPIVLISGPSGSGKTTTAMKLEHLFDSWGCEAHTISLDNYFKELDEAEQQLAKEGKLDLESPARLDNEFLNHQIECMLNGESVDIPRYNFANCKREFPGFTLKRKENEIIDSNVKEEVAEAEQKEAAAENEENIFTETTEEVNENDENENTKKEEDSGGDSSGRDS